MKHPFKPLDLQTFKWSNILRHAANGDEDIATWKKNGTLVIPGVVDFLQEIQDIIDEEFAMYLHHYEPSDKKKGWLRNMFYSLVQQIIRTDPVVYGLNVALRPDNNHRLVACGYATKYADGSAGISTGNKTGFTHMDADLVALVERGINKNMLTCGVSLDDEDEKNCTIVVHGTHKRSAEILAKLKELGKANTRPVTTTDFSNWRQDLQKDFGAPTPVPCERYGMRVSLVSVVHGSTPLSTLPRRVVFPWYLGYTIDYVFSDIPDTHTWAEQQRNHMERVPPTKEPSGKKPSMKTPPSLPWSIPMTFHPLGEACLARLKYEDPRVLFALEQLFHDDAHVHHAYVRKVRAKSIASLKKAWKQVKKAEFAAAVDPEDSYFAEEFLRRDEDS
jgi:hypothetical protein